MEPIEFIGANITLVAEGCGDLPAQKDDEQFLTCWKMTLRERIAAVFFGRVWLCVQGGVHPPVWLKCKRDVYTDD